MTLYLVNLVPPRAIGLGVPQALWSCKQPVERQAQPEPDRLDKLEPVSETDRYDGEQPSQQVVEDR